MQLFNRAVVFLDELKKNDDSFLKSSADSDPCIAFLSESLPNVPLILFGDWFFAIKLLDGPIICYSNVIAFSLTSSKPTTMSLDMKATRS